MTATEYYLPHHVYVCWRRGSAIFLDLHQDDYTLVSGQAAEILRALSERETGTPDGMNASGVLKELLESGLLTTNPKNGKPIRPTAGELALEPLVDPDAPPTISITPMHVVRFFSSCAWATFRLRFCKIEYTVNAVKRRKAGFERFSSTDIHKARELTAIFSVLRALFPRNYLCLYDSLALIHFLGRYEVFPDWVFGVTLEPWGAHCWVQNGRFIFNEDVEEAAGYTPVMLV